MNAANLRDLLKRILAAGGAVSVDQITAPAPFAAPHWGVGAPRALRR